MAVAGCVDAECLSGWKNMASAEHESRGPSVVPELGYVDARNAIRWLSEVLGLRSAVVVDGADGAVAHAELWWFDAAIYVETVDSEDERGQSTVCVVAADDGEVDRIYERALEASAEIAFPLSDTAFGSHQFAVRDPEGHTWSVGTYRPSAPSRGPVA